MDLAIQRLKGFFVLGERGELIYSQYYDPDLRLNSQEQAEIHKDLFSRVSRLLLRSEPEIVSVRDYACVFRPEVDLYFAIVGAPDDNELLLSEVLFTIVEALKMIFGDKLQKRTLLENFDILLLTLDETIDDGVILETDPAEVAQRVDRSEGMGIGEDKDPIVQVAARTKKQIVSSFEQIVHAIFG